MVLMWHQTGAADHSWRQLYEVHGACATADQLITRGIAARLRQCKHYSWKHNYWAVRSPNNAGLTTQVAAKMRCYIEWCYTVTHVWVKGWILWLCGLEASQLDYFLEIYLSCLPVCFFESTVRRWCRFLLQTKLHASILSLFGLITPFLHLLAPLFLLQILPKLH